jgi:hypothetical protein
MDGRPNRRGKTARYEHGGTLHSVVPRSDTLTRDRFPLPSQRRLQRRPSPTDRRINWLLTNTDLGCALGSNRRIESGVMYEHSLLEQLKFPARFHTELTDGNLPTVQIDR